MSRYGRWVGIARRHLVRSRACDRAGIALLVINYVRGRFPSGKEPVSLPRNRLRGRTFRFLVRADSRCLNTCNEQCCWHGHEVTAVQIS